MLQNRFTGLNLLSDLSVGCTTDQSTGVWPSYSLLLKPNLDRSASAEEGSSLSSLGFVVGDAGGGCGAAGPVGILGFEFCDDGFCRLLHALPLTLEFGGSCL